MTKVKKAARLKNFTPPPELSEYWMYWSENDQGWFVKHRVFREEFGSTSFTEVVDTYYTFELKTEDVIRRKEKMLELTEIKVETDAPIKSLADLNKLKEIFVQDEEDIGLKDESLPK